MDDDLGDKRGTRKKAIKTIQSKLGDWDELMAK
jgi:hypothetical protein